MAEGVKGLLSINSESFVVWALKILHESDKRARGCGGLLILALAGRDDRRAIWKLSMRAMVELTETWRAPRPSESLDPGGAISYVLLETLIAVQLQSKEVYRDL